MFGIVAYALAGNTEIKAMLREKRWRKLQIKDISDLIKQQSVMHVHYQQLKATGYKLENSLEQMFVRYQHVFDYSNPNSDYESSFSDALVSIAEDQSVLNVINQELREKSSIVFVNDNKKSHKKQKSRRKTESQDDMYNDAVSTDNTDSEGTSENGDTVQMDDNDDNQHLFDNDPPPKLELPPSYVSSVDQEIRKELGLEVVEKEQKKEKSKSKSSKKKKSSKESSVEDFGTNAIFHKRLLCEELLKRTNSLMNEQFSVSEHVRLQATESFAQAEQQAFFDLIKEGKLEHVQYMLSCKKLYPNVSIDSLDQNNVPCVLLIVEHGHVKLLEWCIEQDQSLLRRTFPQGQTIASYAVLKNQPVCVILNDFLRYKYYGEKKFHTDFYQMQTGADETVAHWCVKKIRPDILEFLLKRAPELAKHKNLNDQTPLEKLKTMMNHLLQTSALTQPRTSLSEFADAYKHHHPRSSVPL